jgi:outer membrane protein assembly factor BamB
VCDASGFKFSVVSAAITYKELNRLRKIPRVVHLMCTKINGEQRKMQMTKKITTAMALFLISAFAVSLVAMPAANAHTTPWIITDHAYIAAQPNPIGVGQTALITFWTAQPLPNSALTNNIRKENYTVTVTLPDESVKTLWNPTDIVANPGGIQTITYVPADAGNYTFTFTFGGMTYPTLDQVTSTVPLSASINASINALAGDVYTPQTATATLTVQEEPLTQTVYPLPTAYWTRPIEGENIYWYTIASNWLGPSSAQLGSYQQNGWNCFQSSGTAPNSGHIMWTKPIEFGGVIGGSNTGVPGATYYSGSSYEPRFYNAIIINGYLYFRMPLSDLGANGAYVCLDLRTGETIWTDSTISPTWGQVYNEVDPNQSGGIPSGYLWQSSGSTWMAYDGFTGARVMNITGVPSGTTAYGENGELLRYCLNYNTTSQTGTLALWNTTAVIFNPAAPSGPYRPTGQTFDGSVSTAFNWNVTINANLDGLRLDSDRGATAVIVGGPTINAVLPGDILFGTSSGLTLGPGSQYTPNPYTMWAINLNASRGQIGKVLWVQNYTAPELMAGNNNIGSYTLRFGCVDPTNRVITLECSETMQWYGFSLDSGNPVWGPTTTVFSDDYQFFGSGLGSGQSGIDAYGNIYVQGYGGCVWCYDTSNGDLLWTFGNGGPGNSTNDGLNSPWGLLPTMVTAVADGKVYAYTTQHGNGAQSPYYVNERIYCLNATTGEQIWSMLAQCPNDGGPGYPEDIVADGTLMYYNMYDNQIYAVGQGPSATTVTAPDPVTSVGSPMIIRGTVTDISAGTKQNQQAADFPNGVPCVSDASQSEWMEYVYMQKPKPADATGVPVTIDVIDSNGNYRNIGTAISDSSGMFTLTWMPDISGNYTVIATFAGSNSYWGSSAETSFYATEAPAATPAPTPMPTSLADTYFVPAVIGILVAIVVVGAVLFLLLRKKP